MALELVADQGGSPQAQVVRGPRTSAAWAAFGNGVLAHSLDYDDTHLPSVLHPSASVVPAALAAAERHGDAVRSDGGSAANDLIVMGTHVGTHIDALAHVSHEGLLHGGASADEAQRGGRFTEGGVEQVQPGLVRGVLLDVPAALGLHACEPGFAMTAEVLTQTAKAQDTTLTAGDVVLVRSGWAQRWGDKAAYVGHDTGVPGPDESGASWLASHRPRAVGADSIAFEHLPPGSGHARLPAHRVLLVESGVNIIETLDLEELAATGVREFPLLLSPLNLVGATGAPVRPLALVDA
jgi:kynurenine formamidase